MKKIIIASITVCTLVLAACGGGEPAKNISADPNYQKGKILVASSDCLTCHEINGTAIGPSYTAIANKYDNTDANVTMLSQKIIAGGSGHWGATPMAMHPDITQDNAKTMVRYILLLRTKK